MKTFVTNYSQEKNPCDTLRVYEQGVYENSLKLQYNQLIK